MNQQKAPVAYPNISAPQASLTQILKISFYIATAGHIFTPPIIVIFAKYKYRTGQL
jgi:hypothetical protein